MDESKVSCRVFIIARGNSAILFQTLKKTFYHIAKFIQNFIIRNIFRPIFARPNNRFSTSGSDL